MTKLRMVIKIVDWEHRYKYEWLQGGSWCLQRIEELMKLKRAVVHRRFKELFN